MENKLNQFKQRFESEAKVKQDEVLLSKAIVMSPFFSSSASLSEITEDVDSLKSEELKEIYKFKNVQSTQNAVLITFDEEELNNTQYKFFAFYGYQLNTELHYVFFNSLVSYIHKSYLNGKHVFSLDFSEFLKSTFKNGSYDKAFDNYTFYKKTFEEVLSRLFNSSIRIVMKNGNELNDRYIYKYSSEFSSIYTITFSETIFIDAILNDFSVKISPELRMNLKAGAARILFDKIDKMQFNNVAKIRKSLLLKMVASSKNNAESNDKNLSRVLNYFIQIGYVSKIVDVKDKETKKVVEKIIYINKDFKLENLAPESEVIEIKPASKKTTASKSVQVKLGFEDEEERLRNNLLNQLNISMNANSFEDKVVVAESVSVDIFAEFDLEPDFSKWEKEAAEAEGRREVNIDSDEEDFDF